MDIELYCGSTKAIVSTKGGYVTNLADDEGDILYPKRVLKDAAGNEKTRGGSHVCLPNFGPGGTSGLDQHGYGRTSEWEVRDRSETQVKLFLAGQGEYTKMDSYLTYRVSDESFEMVLRFKNTGTSPLNVAPAFHPYWYRGGEMPKVNDVTYDDLAEFSEAKFIDGDAQHLHLAGRELTLRSGELTRWVQWTDQLGDYFCLEPSQSGFAFDEDISRADSLEAGAEKTYSFIVSW
jgi:D-hexose-6-phosphate mutarotase